MVEGRAEQKNKKSSKSRKLKKLNKKKSIKLIIFFVKISGSVQFRFPKPETGKTPTEPNQLGLRGTINRKKKNLTLDLDTLTPATPCSRSLILTAAPHTTHTFTHSATKSS